MLPLPDSRLSRTSPSINRGILGTWIPLFCAHCGTPGGSVPEAATTFAFWLCNPCFASHGSITHLYAMPDELFWERLKQEQHETYGRLLTNPELQSIIDANTSPLATLIREGT